MDFSVCEKVGCGDGVVLGSIVDMYGRAEVWSVFGSVFGSTGPVVGWPPLDRRSPARGASGLGWGWSLKGGHRREPRERGHSERKGSSTRALALITSSTVSGSAKLSKVCMPRHPRSVRSLNEPFQRDLAALEITGNAWYQSISRSLYACRRTRVTRARRAWRRHACGTRARG